MFDIIGDIHGHADKLEDLLVKLEYKKINGLYSHANRKVLFVGDYIDRGPKIKETLKIVKTMVDHGSAIALMGNHEYNALCFYYKSKNGVHLREHTIKNILQHKETIDQFKNNQEEYNMYINWFKTLPLFYESESIRAVHACWDYKSIKYLKKILIHNRLTEDLLHASSVKGSLLNDAIEIILKGKEMEMPNGLSFIDKDGTIRTAVRVKWWENPLKKTFKSISIIDMPSLPEKVIKASEIPSSDFYQPLDKNVFFGHYWLKGEPKLFKKNICCLDYSVAKGGSLVAYRYNNELNLDENNFVFF